MNTRSVPRAIAAPAMAYAEFRKRTGAISVVTRIAERYDGASDFINSLPQPTTPARRSAHPNDKLLMTNAC